MRSEQQMIREWADNQAEQNREIKHSAGADRAPVAAIANKGRQMALARGRRSDPGFNYWPGFVDALSTLVLAIVFLLSVFLVAQFYLSQEVTGKDKALERLNAQIAQLTELLSLEKAGKLSLDDQLSQMRAGLAAAETERDRITGLDDGRAATGNDAAGRIGELSRALDSEKQVSARALAQIEVLNQQISALRRQLAALEQALDASEQKDKESQTQIADLGQRLNVALAQRVQELSRYRSDFFGRLRAHPRQPPRHPRRRRPLRVPVGSVLRHRTGACCCPKAAAELDKLASAIARTGKADPFGDRLGAAGRRPYRLRGRSRARSSSRTGNCRPRAPSRWCNT